MRSRHEITLPAILSRKDIERVPLPALYLAARDALRACARVDECKDVQDRFSAIAQYARQAQNKELMTLARRIALRAERRMGELLLAIPKYNRYNDNGEGRGEVIKRNGVSTGVAYRALAIARMPEKAFEEVVESDSPPGRDAFGKTARKKLSMSRPSDKQRATFSAMRLFLEFWQQYPPEALTGSFSEPTVNAQARGLLASCQEYLAAFALILTEEP